jgi:hypothetical protein
VTALKLWAWPLAFDIPPPPSPSPSTGPVATSYGFVAYIGGFFALGLIVLIMIVLTRRPKSGR